MEQELDFGRLITRIIHSEEFKQLKSKESPIDGYVNADQFVRDVAASANNIASEFNLSNQKNNKEGRLNRRYCELLAYIKYLGMPAYGKEGQIAFNETLGKSYSQSDVNQKLAEKKLRIPLNEKMINDIKQMEYENLDDVTSNEARTVLLAQNMMEYLQLLTDEETKQLGGITLQLTLEKECFLNKDGKLVPGRLYNKISLKLDDRKKKGINKEKVERAKQNLENGVIKGVIEPPQKEPEEKLM